MSIRLVMAVLDSDLTAGLKPYAQAYARYANNDGTRVYPGIERIARDLRKSVRQVQRATRELEQRGVLTLMAPHGPHRAACYRFNARALPQPGDGDQLPLWGKLGQKKTFPQTDRVDC